jgi:hypothetical protein
VLSQQEIEAQIREQKEAEALEKEAIKREL